MTAPARRQIPVATVLPLRSDGPLVLLVGPGPWSGPTAQCYAAGWAIVELDAQGRPQRAYLSADSPDAEGPAA